MNETSPQVPQYDEIQRIDLLRVIWKWKYLILASTLVCALLAAIYSLNMPKIYRIDMTLQPDVIKTNDAGGKIYVDSANSIAALIKTGTFDNAILNHYKSSDSMILSAPFLFKVKTDQTDIINVSYETPIIKEGIVILNQLAKALSDYYAEQLEHFKDVYENDIMTKKSELMILKTEEQVAKNFMNNIQIKLTELKSEIGSTNKNIEILKKQREDLLKKNNKNTVIASLLYSNIIQENLQLKNTMNSHIFDYTNQNLDAQLRLEKVQENIKILSRGIDKLENEKNKIQAFQIIKPPTATSYPIKPKTKLNVMLATLVGLMFMLFIAFFLEYLKNLKSGKTNTLTDNNI